MVMPRLTPTQQRFMELTADGERHKLAEFIALLPDPLGDKSNVLFHVDSLRKIIRPLGQDIVSERVQNTKTYRRVRLLSHSSGE